MTTLSPPPLEIHFRAARWAISRPQQVSLSALAAGVAVLSATPDARLALDARLFVYHHLESLADRASDERSPLLGVDVFL